MDTTTANHHTDCRHISGTGWCCAPQCGRPVINVRKGDVRAAFPVMAQWLACDHNGNGHAYAVEIVCQSPTGDQSDSITYHLPCATGEQAESVAAMWRKAWGIPAYGNSANLDMDGIPQDRSDDHKRNFIPIL